MLGLLEERAGENAAPFWEVAPDPKLKPMLCPMEFRADVGLVLGAILVGIAL